MDLEVKERSQFGKKVKALRAEGFIPAEFYGHGMANRHLAVEKGTFRKLFKVAGENTVIQIVEGGKKQPALIYHVEHDFLTNEPAHVDFYGVRMDQKITTHVPIEFMGDAPGVKEKGAVLAKNLSEIEVEALPGDIPHSFVVDISSLLEFNQSIYVHDLPVPRAVKIMTDGETVMVSLSAPREEEVAPVAPVDISEVKVETEEKKAERAAAKGEEGEPAK